MCHVGRGSVACGAHLATPVRTRSDSTSSPAAIHMPRLEEGTMAIHAFTVVLDREPTDDEFEILGTTCDDAAFIGGPGGSVAEFDREARIFGAASAWAVRDP